MSTPINFNEVKRLVNHDIDNNILLQENGKKPISICIQGDAGVGKTSILEQIAEERNMSCTKVSCHEFEEAGDVLGYPCLEYECQVAKKYKAEDGTIKMKILPNTMWLNAKQLDSMDKSMAIKQTGNTRMGYAKPAWVPDYNENGNLVIFDDYGRCNQTILGAMMELIYTQGNMSWKFPKKTTLALTSNPDNGEYNVNTQDIAQRTRYLTYDVKFDVGEWAKWAEKEGIDGRCINFVLTYADTLFEADENGNRICNPRSFCMFADMISSIKDWDKKENADFISLIAKGCFMDENGRFASMFSAFIKNKMHKLIQPKEMLLGAWDKVKTELEATIYDSNGTYRPDLATLLERRFTNYVGAWLDSDDKTPISKVKDRILEFIDYPENGGKVFFNPDLFIHMIKNITAEHKNQTNKLLFEPKIAKIISG